jgi:Family of unknown function (DUF5946)
VPDREPLPPTETCPGCGAVLAPASGPRRAHRGASPSCARLFEVTLGGLREEAGASGATASVVALADAAYDAQHPDPADGARRESALSTLGAPDAGAPPQAWRTTIADVAADLDVIDLTVLVESWARTVREDWTAGRA